MAYRWKAAFQGVPGAYSEEAIMKYFGEEVPTKGFPTFDEAFAAVQNDQAELGFLPAENSTAGTITQTYDLLFDSNLSIVGEFFLRIHHNLLALPGTEMETIQRVYSHPQGLAQCQGFLKKHAFEPVVEFDTAGSARKIRDENMTDAAAIASARAAEVYGLSILEKNIEDFDTNTTRFFILSKGQAQPSEKNKTSIVFSIRHEPGELLRCLEEFATRNINLTKIESRPEKERPWHYVFYLDFEGYVEDPPVEKALVNLLKRAIFVKVLGSYPVGRTE
jgi:prephenate dehydratase